MKWQKGNDYVALLGEINELNDEIRHCWSRLTSPRIGIGERRGSNTSDMVGEGVAKVVDMEQKLAEKVECLKQIRLEIEERIESFPSMERRLLRMRYIRCFSWQQIANRLYCDESTCRRIHRKILRQLGG